MRDLPTPGNEPETNPGIREAYRLIIIEIEQLRITQQQIIAKLEKAEAARNLLRQLLSSEGEISRGRSRGTQNRKDAKKSTRHRKGSQTDEVITRSKAILTESGRPLERGELLEKIEASGFQIQTRNPARFIGRTLWESDDFVHIPKEGYWLKDDDLPKSAL